MRNLTESLELIANSPSLYHEFDKLSVDELERYIRKLENLKKVLEFKRERKLSAPVQNTGQLYDVKQAAEKLGVTTQTIYNKITSGDLKVNRVGKVLRISEEQIQEFLRSQKA